MKQMHGMNLRIDDSLQDLAAAGIIEVDLVSRLEGGELASGAHNVECGSHRLGCLLSLCMKIDLYMLG